LRALLVGLENAGADHLYIERYDAPGLTGDERDLLGALKASYLDEPLEAEAALGALLPPGRTDAVMGIVESITGSHATLLRTRATGALLSELRPAACH